MSNSPRNRPSRGQPARGARPTSTAGAKGATSGRTVAAPPRRSSRTGWIVGGVLAVVVVLAAVIAIASSSDDTDDTPTVGDVAPGATAAGGTTEAAPGTAEVQPASITGAPLPPYPGNGEHDPGLGATIPAVAGADFSGQPVTIGTGTATLLVFLAHWCPHCQAEVPRLVEWNADGQVPAGVNVIGVSTAVDQTRGNHPPSVWLREEGWPWPVLADSPESSVALAFGLSSFPYFVLYDDDGRVAMRVTGEVEMNDLTSMIEEALAV